MLNEILKDSNYKLSQFSDEQIKKLEKSIFIKEIRGKETPHINCLKRNKDIKLTPEEVVRQLYIMVLTEVYDYSIEYMELEYSVSFGREKKRADIVLFKKVNRHQFPRHIPVVLGNAFHILSETVDH